MHSCFILTIVTDVVSLRRSRVSGSHWGLIRKYGLNINRQSFRELAKDIGFVKVGACQFLLGQARISALQRPVGPHLSGTAKPIAEAAI